MAELSKKDRKNIEGVAALLAQGKTLEHISIDTALDLPYLEQLTSSKAFKTLFLQIDPDAFHAWEENQKDVAAKKLVKTLARGDAVKHYEMLRDIVHAGDLTDKDRAAMLIKMLDLSGTTGDEVIEEIVQLSRASLANITEALNETAGD